MPGIDMPKALSRALQLKFNKFVVIFFNLPLDKSHYISVLWKGMVNMVTYSDLFTFVICAIVTLARNGKDRR